MLYDKKIEEVLSENERRLAIAIGLEAKLGIYVNVTAFYSWMVEHCFLNRVEGPAADALRRAYIHLNHCTAYRGSPEFEDSLKF